MSQQNPETLGHTFEAKLQEEFDVTKWHDIRVLVAVSGGADSVALVRGLSAMRPVRMQ